MKEGIGEQAGCFWNMSILFHFFCLFQVENEVCFPRRPHREFLLISLHFWRVVLVVKTNLRQLHHERDISVVEWVKTILFLQYLLVTQLTHLPPLKISLLDIHVSKWSQNPYVRAAWTDPVVGTSWGHYENMAGRLGNLFFAGESTSSEWMGFVQGGYFTGQAKAKEIISCLKGKKCKPYRKAKKYVKWDVTTASDWECL